MSDAPLPPGSTGIPWLGEAHHLARDPFAFVRDRAASHGTVARSRLLGRDLILLSGPSTAPAFVDPENIRRAGGLPPHAAALFGAGVVNQIDGDAHRVRKAHLMAALGPEALAALLPVVRERLRARIAAWAAKGEVSLQAEARLAGMALTYENFTGLVEGDDRLAEIGKGYADFGSALVGLPFALPGTALRRAQRFVEAQKAVYADVVRQRRAAPGNDVVSRLLGSEVDGQRLADEDLVLELQHLVFAASGLWAWFCVGAEVLARDTALAERLRAAIAGLPAEPSGRQYVECELLTGFVMEVKRVAMIVPFTAIGVAKRDFVVDGFKVPAKALVAWSTHASHVTPKVAPYSDPARFDADRYGAGRQEHAAPHAFAPQGPGQPLTSHRCAGVEYTTLVLEVFFVELLRGSTFTVPEQDLSLDSSSIPAHWPSGLRVRFTPVR